MKKVLIVDDDQYFLNSFSEFLRSKFDCEFITLSKGYDAIKIAEQQNIDLVITDYCMQDGDGGSLSFYCHEHHIPFAVVTGLEIEDVKPYLPKDATILNKLSLISDNETTQLIENKLEIRSTDKQMLHDINNKVTSLALILKCLEINYSNDKLKCAQQVCSEIIKIISINRKRQ